MHESPSDTSPHSGVPNRSKPYIRVPTPVTPTSGVELTVPLGSWIRVVVRLVAVDRWITLMLLAKIELTRIVVQV
jgi:hypothetical protein